MIETVNFEKVNFKHNSDIESIKTVVWSDYPIFEKIKEDVIVYYYRKKGLLEYVYMGEKYQNPDMLFKHALRNIIKKSKNILISEYKKVMNCVEEKNMRIVFNPGIKSVFNFVVKIERKNPFSLTVKNSLGEDTSYDKEGFLEFKTYEDASKYFVKMFSSLFKDLWKKSFGEEFLEDNIKEKHDIILSNECPSCKKNIKDLNIMKVSYNFKGISENINEEHEHYLCPLCGYVIAKNKNESELFFK